jgi:RNA-directed DNA polymerase
MQLKQAVSSVLETTKQETETNWCWVEASVWTERMLIALDNGVKGGKWFSLMDKVYAMKTLEAAWQQVAKNKGSYGVDSISIERFASNQVHYLEELHEALKGGYYQPQAVKRVYIPKSDGKQRPLGIPTVKDRVVQTALKMVIEPIFERDFVEHSYGFRPQRGCKDALREVDALIKAGNVWVVDADLKSYFDTIPHDLLMKQIESKISDGGILDLIQSFLKQNIMDGVDTWTPVGGTPQGAVMSPLLANIYLHPLDRQMQDAGVNMVRYADDFVILCQSEVQAQITLKQVQDWVATNGLTLHPDKTHLGNCMEKGQGFEFLGYRFENGKRLVRKKSLKALKDKIRSKTKRSRGDSLKRIIQDLNPMLKGWYNYFKHANRWIFRNLDSFIRRRLRSLRYKQTTGQSFFGKSQHVHRLFPNTYFATHGLFTMTEAHAVACQSRCGNT